LSGELDLLTPSNSQLIIIDHQPQMAFGVQSIDRQALKNNVVALAKAAQHRPCSAPRRRHRDPAPDDVQGRGLRRALRPLRRRGGADADLIR
jgi:nicotinamidase-related amidase